MVISCILTQLVVFWFSSVSWLIFHYPLLMIFHWFTVCFVYHYDMNFYFFIILILYCSIMIVIVGDIVLFIKEFSKFRFLGVVNWEESIKTLTIGACYTKRKNTLNLVSSVQVQILVRALRVLDILIIVIIVITAAALIYIFWPLIIAIIIMAVGYFIYRWYMKRKRLNSD